MAVAAGGLVGRQLPDLVLVDWMMPNITGIEIECGYAAGADDFIVKPFSPQAMVHRVAAVLARCQART